MTLRYKKSSHLVGVSSHEKKDGGGGKVHLDLPLHVSISSSLFLHQNHCHQSALPWMEKNKNSSGDFYQTNSGPDLWMFIMFNTEFYHSVRGTSIRKVYICIGYLQRAICKGHHSKSLGNHGNHCSVV